MLDVFDVIWLFDDGARGEQKRRMMVCVLPEEGFFFRINSAEHFRPSVQIFRDPHHSWLSHDSFVQCDLLVYDEFPIHESLAENGIVGTVHVSMISKITECLRAGHFKQSDKLSITAALRSFERQATE